MEIIENTQVGFRVAIHNMHVLSRHKKELDLGFLTCTISVFKKSFCVCLSAVWQNIPYSF